MWMETKPLRRSLQEKVNITEYKREDEKYMSHKNQSSNVCTDTRLVKPYTGNEAREDCSNTE